MLIYAVSDIHGSPEKLSKIRRNVAEHNPDVPVVAGDVTNYHDRRRVVSELNDLHLKETVLNGVRFAGVSGAIPVPFRTRLRWIERLVR